MKLLATAGTAALLTFGLAAQASAYTFSPTSTAVQGIGSTTLGSLTCTSTFNGITSSSGATAGITSGSFTGGLCPLATLNPTWTITPTGTSSVTISNISINDPLLGTCTGSVNASVTQNGTTTTTLTWTSQTLSPTTCVTHGSEVLTPQVTIH